MCHKEIITGDKDSLIILKMSRFENIWWILGAFMQIIAKNVEKKVEKVWRLRKSTYLCSPFEKERFKKFIEKTVNCTSKYREKYNLSRSVDSFEELREL